MKKGTLFEWGKKQQKAFDQLRHRFLKEPVLALWKPDRLTRIEVDASGYATGGVLSQKLEDGEWHPVAYRSSSMDENQRN